MITDYNEARVALRNEYDYPPEVVETLLKTLGYEKPKPIKLELAPEEATVLRSLLLSVRGDPKTTARKYTDSILDKLLDIDAGRFNADMRIAYHPTKDKIYFT